MADPIAASDDGSEMMTILSSWWPGHGYVLTFDSLISHFRDETGNERHLDLTIPELGTIYELLLPIPIS